MKRIEIVGLSVVMMLLLVLAAACGGGGASVSEETFTLRGGHYANAGAFFAEEQRFANALGIKSNQRVKMDIVWSSGYGKSNELLGLTSKGSIDAGAVPPGHYPDQLPFNKVFQVPFIGLSLADYARIKETLIAEFPFFEEEYTKLGVKRLYYQTLPVFWIVGNGDPDECTLAGLKGKKIRSFGDSLPELYKAAGAVAVDVPPVEWYEALQRGTIDFTSVPIGAIIDNKLHEVSNMACGPIFSFVGHDWVINLDKFNSMPEDLQKLIVDTANDTKLRYVEFAEQITASAKKDIVTEGMVVKILPAADLAEWTANAPDLLAKWEEDLAGKGKGEEARAVGARFRELLAQ